MSCRIVHFNHATTKDASRSIDASISVIIHTVGPGLNAKHLIMSVLSHSNKSIGKFDRKPPWSYKGGLIGMELLVMEYTVSCNNFIIVIKILSIFNKHSVFK